MDTLEITLQRRQNDHWPVTVEYTQPGRLPRRDEGQLRLDAVQQRGLKTQALNPRRYGEILGQALLRDRVGEAFTQARDQSATPLRALLVVEDPELLPLHWEWLCGPVRPGERWDFLTLDERTLYSRYLPGLNDRLFPALGPGDLRALALVANLPADNEFGLARFDETATVAGIRRALGDIPHTILANLPVADGPPTLEELLRRLSAGPVPILHLVVHGWVRPEDGETVLYFLDEAGGVVPVTATTFLERLNSLDGAGRLPHLAFLETCASAAPRTEAEGALAGLAQRLVQDLGLPAALALTEKVPVTTAERLATAFYDRLYRHGQLDQALVEATRSLARQGDLTIPALFTRLAGRPLVSNGQDRPLKPAEINTGLDRLLKLLPARAPALQPALNRLATTVRSSLAASHQADDAALAELNQRCETILELSFIALARGQEPPPYDSRPPFLGLRAFSEADHDLFFGREDLVARLRGRLAAHNFLAVVGPPGCGKSSLVLAGLAPALQAELPALRLATLTPGSNPAARLADAVRPLVGQPFVVIIDRFEELFTLTDSQAQREAFLGALWRLVERIPVIVIMRAEFWGECAALPDLKEQLRAHQELIAPMSPAELRGAIEQQAARTGLRFEADLSHTILAELEAEPLAMPVLQHTLLALWRHREGRWLKAEAYRAIGGVRHALAETAESVYRELAPGDQGLLRQLFIRLAGPEDRPAVPAGCSGRRAVPIAALVPAGSSLEAIRPLVDRLAEHHLVDLRSGLPGGEQRVELALDSMPWRWPRLGEWLADDRDLRRLRRELTAAAQAWEAAPAGEQPGLLVHGGGRLEAIEALFAQGRLALEATEQAYLAACAGWREEQRARQAADREAALAAARRTAGEAETLRQAETVRAESAETRALAAGARAAQWRRRAGRLALLLAAAALLAVAAGLFATRSFRDAGLARAMAATAEAALALGDQGPDQAGTIAANRAITDAPAATRVTGAQADASLAATRVAEAEAQARLALSRQLAAQGQLHLAAERDLALLLAVEAMRSQDSPEAYSLLYRAVTERPQLLAWFRGPAAWIHALAVSADGRRLAAAGCIRPNTRFPVTACPGIEVTLLDLADFRPAGPALALPDEPLSSLALNDDGSLLAAGTADGRILLWDLADPRAAKPAGGFNLDHGQPIVQVGFRPGGDWLAVASAGGGLSLHELGGEPVGEPLVTADDLYSIETERYLPAFVFSPDGARLAADLGPEGVGVWSLENQSLQSVLPRGDGLQAMAFDPAGQLLAVAGFRSVAVWDLSSGRVAGSTTPSGEVLALRFAADGALLLVAAERPARSQGDSLLVARYPDPGLDAFNDFFTVESDHPVHGVLFAGDRLVGASCLTAVERLNPDPVCGASLLQSWAVDRAILPGLRAEWPSPAAAGSVSDLTFSADGAQLLQLRVDPSGAQARVWTTDLATGEASPPARIRLRGVLPDDAFPALAAISPAGVVAVGVHDGTVVVWERAGGDQRAELHLEAQLQDLALSPDGDLLLTRDVTGLITWWQWDGSRYGVEATHSTDGVGLVAAGAAGQTLATLPDRLILQPGSEASWTMPLAFPGLDTALSADGRWLLLAVVTAQRQAPGEALVLWDLLARQEIGRLPLVNRDIRRVAISPDGQWLAVEALSGLFNAENVTLLLENRADLWLAQACTVANRNLTPAEWRRYLGDRPYQETCGGE